LDHFPDFSSRIIREANTWEKEQHQGYSSNPAFGGGKGFVLGHMSPGQAKSSRTPEDVDV